LHFVLSAAVEDAFASARLLLARLQPRKDLPDGPEVIGRVSSGGEGGGSAHIVPIRVTLMLMNEPASTAEFTATLSTIIRMWRLLPVGNQRVLGEEPGQGRP
jgi:hypothetical protein